MTEEPAGAALPSDSESPQQQPELDWLVPDTWDPEVEKALDAWQQGHLLPGGTLSWASLPGEDIVTGVSAGADHVDSNGADKWAHIKVDDIAFDWVIVTSQTCDVAAVGPGARHPFVQVSPIVRMGEISENRMNAIQSHAVSHLVALTSPPADGFWVVDLRVSMPVSKYLLAVSTPAAAFADEQDLLDFSEHVAMRIRRPSLHDVISFDMSRSLGDYIKTVSKKSPEWWEKVEQLRVCLGRSRLSPDTVQLLVVQQNQLEAGEREFWRSWAKQFSKVLDGHEMKMLPVHFTSWHEMSAQLYRESVQLRVPELRRPQGW